MVVCDCGLSGLQNVTFRFVQLRFVNDEDVDEDERSMIQKDH